jgi:hypothetical protein
MFSLAEHGLNLRSARFQIPPYFRVGKYDQLPVIGPVRIQVQPFHVPLKWNQNTKVRETENILRSVGVQSRAPLYLLPALRHTLHPIDLHTEITIQKGGKPEPISFGKEYHLHPEKNKETTFAISGEISRHVTKGDIVLLLVKAHYPKSETFHARTIEFLEVFHIKDK